MRLPIALPAAAVAAALVLAAPAPAAVAPGRVTFPLSPSSTLPSVDGFAPAVGVALPDGGAVLAGIERGKGLLLAGVRRDGTLDDAFGVHGIARIAISGDPQYLGPFPTRVLRRPDGRLVVLYQGVKASKYEYNHLEVASITPDGRLDESFGDHGIADVGLQIGGGAALLPDGRLVMAGTRGQVSPAIEHDPNAPRDFRWTVARVTAAGTLDTTFGDQGFATVPGENGSGGALGIAGDGAILCLGTTGSGPPVARLARLTPAGALDPAFGSGGVADVGSGTYASDLAVHADGSTTVVTVDPNGVRARRFTAAGAPDAAFGSVPLAGPASLAAAQLRGAPDGSDVALAVTGAAHADQPAELRFARIAPGGTVTPAPAIAPGFGGGIAAYPALHRPVLPMTVDQRGYSAGSLIVRPDGSLLLPGTVTVVQYTGEGTGFEHEEEAALSLTPGFAPDRAFGGPGAPATLAVAVPRQRAATAGDPHRYRIATRVVTSGPGLVRLRVRAGGRLIADSTEPAMRAGAHRLNALLTVEGRRWLRRHRHVRIAVAATFRDLVRRTATAKATATLR